MMMFWCLQNEEQKICSSTLVASASCLAKLCLISPLPIYSCQKQLQFCSDTCQVVGLSAQIIVRGVGDLGGGENDWMTGSSWSECLMFTFIQSLMSLIGDGRVSHGELISSASLKLAPEFCLR